MPEAGNPQALNRYSYGFNSPVKYVDPSGHDPVDWINEQWQQEFYDAHGQAPKDIDVVYRIASMAIASGYSDAGAVLEYVLDAGNSTRSRGGQTGGEDSGIGGVASRVSGYTWGLINDIIGKTLGAMSGSPRQSWEDGNIAVYENVGGFARFIVYDWLGRGRDNAVTIGHAILNSTRFDLSTKEGRWWYAHEREHVKQSDILGPLYLIAYGLGYLAPGTPSHDFHFMEFRANQVASQQVPGVR